MNLIAEHIERLRPQFSERDSQELARYDTFMDEHHFDISQKLRNRLVGNDVFGPILSSQTPEQHLEQDRHSRKLQKEAIVEGKWDAYTSDLLTQGVMYAQMGLQFADWSYVVKIYREMVCEVAFNQLKGQLGDLMAVLSGMNKIIDYALHVITESYFIEKNALLSKAQKESIVAQEELKKSEELIKTLFENSSDYIYMIDTDGVILYINHVAPGLKKSEVVGSNIFGYQTAENKVTFKNAIDNAIQAKKPTFYMHEIKEPEGNRYFASSVTPIVENDTVKTIAIISRDITERERNVRKVAELKDALEMKVRQLDLVLKVGKIGVWSWDLTSGHIEWDDTLHVIFDLPKEEFHHRFEDFEDRLHPDDRARVAKEVAASIESGEDLVTEFRIIRRDGSCHYLIGRGITTYSEDGTPLIITGSNMDITDIVSKQIEIDNIRAAIYKSNLVAEFDKKGIFTYVNQAMCDLMEYTQEELIGEHHNKLCLDDIDKIAAFKKFWKLINQGEHHEGIFPRLTKSKKIVWIKGNYNPIIKANGRVAGVLNIATDMTAIKKAEEQIKAFNEELEAKVKLRTAELEATNKELSDFTYTVSHDLRAPVRAIDGFTKVLYRDLHGKLSEQDEHYLDVILENAARMGDLIDDLLSFSRMGQQEPKRDEFSMKALVLDEVKFHMQNKNPSKVKIEVAELNNAPCDREMMRQVWFNLIDNAIKYSATREKSVISIASKIKGKQVIYEVSDNGVGFEMTYVKKVFGIFQRLHEDEFEGTGVGLAIVQRIVNRHGGEVWAESALDKGSKFYFSLPKK